MVLDVLCRGRCRNPATDSLRAPQTTGYMQRPVDEVTPAPQRRGGVTGGAGRSHIISPMTESSAVRPQPTDSPASRYRSDIDGLRAVAVGAVLLYHAGFGFVPGGFTGVDIFFVISGFLIGGHIYAEEQSGRFSFAAFYQRRAKRILPALFAVLLASLLASVWLLSPLELKNFAAEAITTLFSASNIFFRFKQGYFAIRSDLRPLLMTWSLGVEEQFYIFVPLIITWLMRKKARLIPILIAGGVASFVLALYQVDRSPDAAFYLLPARAWELLAGVILAVVLAKRPGEEGRRGSPMKNAGGFVGAALMLAPILLLHASTPFPGAAALPSVLGAVLLLWAEGSWINTVVLPLRPLRYVGRISYSLYLWHWPLLSFAAIVLDVKVTHTQAAFLLAVAFLLSVASYRWVEQPFRRSRTPAVPLLLRYAAATAVLLVIFTGARLTYGLQFRNPALAHTELVDAVGGLDNCFVTDGVAAPPTSAACWEKTGKPAIALWGDSHAESIDSALRSSANAAGFDYAEISKTACPPLADVSLHYAKTPDHAAECIAYNEEAVRELRNDPSIKTVILAGYWKAFLITPKSETPGWLVAKGKGYAMPSQEAAISMFSDGLERTIAQLRASGKHVVVLQDDASFYTSPLWRVRTSALPVRRWLVHVLRPDTVIDPGVDAPQQVSEDRIARTAIEAVAAKTGAEVYDLEAQLCRPDGMCAYRDKDLFYKDFHHLSSSGAAHALTGLRLPM